MSHLRIISLVSFFSFSFLAHATSVTPAKLALNWKAEPQFGGFYQALHEGIFSKNDLSIEILQGGSGTPTLQMLLSKQVDFAIVSADEVVLAHAKGNTQIRAIFATYQTNPQCLISRDSRNFKNLADIFKNDGVLLWQEGLPYAQFLIKKFGPLKVKTAPYQGGITALLTNPLASQQGFITSEPLSAEKEKLKVASFLVSESGFNPYTTVVATREDVLKFNPQLVKKLHSSIATGWGNYLKDPAKTNLEMHRLNPGMDLATFKKSAEAQVHLIDIPQGKEHKLGQMTLERWQTLVNQMAELKIIKSKPDPKQMFVDSLDAVQ